MVPAPDQIPTTARDAGAQTRGPSGTLSDLDLARHQLAAIDRWHAVRRASQTAAEHAATSREARMDLARRLAVIRAEHKAIIDRTDAQLRTSDELLQRAAPRRAIVVHRNSWFADRLAADLALRSISVVARLSNGAEAVGAVVAEQPDLLLVEDSLPMMSGEDVVREVRAFAPLTRVGAQVAYDDRIAAMLEAGAHSAYTRRVPPADVAAALSGLLAPSADPS
jgi:CheY-like chemotaxis protein